MWAELTYDSNTDTWAMPIKRVISTARAVTDARGIQHAASIFRLWPRANLAAVGFTPFREASYDGRRYTSAGLSDDLVDGEVVRSHATQLRDVDRLKVLKRDELRRHRDQVIHGGIEWSPDAGVTVHVLQTDEQSLNRIANTQLFVDKAGRVSQGWRMRNDQVKTLSAAEFHALAVAVGNHVDACYQAQATHEATIDVLTDGQVVIDYDITAGWPAVAAPET
jgi:hypothetical protein